VRSPRKRLSAPARREQLLDVTKTIVGEQGFHAVSIEGVARRAGVSRPIVYGHFGDLRGLLEALLARETARALSQLAAVLPPARDEADPVAALLAAFAGYLEIVRTDPVTWRLVLMPPEGAPELLREQIERGREAVIALLAQVIGHGAGERAGSPDPPLTARLASAVADEAARLTLTDPERYPEERLMDQARWLLGRLAADRPS
jgi:AcrR family transcriptional regulator